MLEAHLAVERVGPCPGIPIDSCECFHRFYDRYLEIVNMNDAVARNWGINLWYQDVSHAFQKLLHTAPDSTLGFPAIGTWPAIAAWSSHAVGFTLRQQALQELWSYIISDLPPWIQSVLDKMPVALVNLLFKEILEKTSVSLGAGNVAIFREIGIAYSRYGMEFCDVPTKPDDAKMVNFVQKYICVDGECPLAKAMWALFKAHYGDGKPLSFSDRDQILLLQSMYAGLAEQTTVDPFINGSLPGYTISWCRFWPSLNRTQCPDLVNKIATKLLVHIIVGSHRIIADQNMPSGVHNGSDFSPYLTTLTIPEVHDVMLKMLNSTTLQLNNTAVSDWNVLLQRLRFVAPLFWVFQDYEEFNCYMYTPEQEFLIRTSQTSKMDKNSWRELCDKDCCAANGRWNGSNN